MKFILLLLLCCCAVAIAQPAGSNESSPSNKGSKEDSHSDSKGSDESHESSEDSSNESGRKDGGGGGLFDPSPGQVTIPQPSPKQLEKLLDHVVEISSSLLGQHDIHNVRDLVNRIQSNPVGSIVWNVAVLPFLRNISYFPGPTLTQLQSTLSQLFPLINYFPPFVLARAIVQFVFSILSSVAKIFVR